MENRQEIVTIFSTWPVCSRSRLQYQMIHTLPKIEFSFQRAREICPSEIYPNSLLSTRLPLEFTLSNFPSIAMQRIRSSLQMTVIDTPLKRSIPPWRDRRQQVCAVQERQIRKCVSNSPRAGPLKRLSRMIHCQLAYRCEVLSLPNGQVGHVV